MEAKNDPARLVQGSPLRGFPAAAVSAGARGFPALAEGASMNRLLELAKQLVGALSQNGIILYLDIEVLLDEIDKELETETGRKRRRTKGAS